MGTLPKFEPLEDRIVLDGIADVTIDGPDNVFIGDQDVDFTLTFDNTSTNDTGYVPFIDLVLPTNGADGYDGVELADVSFLGTPVTTTEIVFDGAGNATHPLAVDTNGDPIIISGTPGDTLVVIELPYGSFSPGNPAVDIDFTLDFSNLADLSSPFNLSATGGFAFGCDPLDNPEDDPSVFGATDGYVVTQQLLEITKTNDIPEAEAATGPNYPYTHTITVEIADGQTLTDFQLVDSLPPEMVYLGNLTTSGGTATVEPTPGPPAGSGGNQLVIDYATASGTFDVTFDFYIDYSAAGSSDPIIDVNSGDQTTITNTVTGTGDWQPIDTNDPQQIGVTDTAQDIYNATSLAIQKSQVLVENDPIVGPTPGDFIDFTLDIQVSDYFTYGDLVVTDVMGNGLGYTAAPPPAFLEFVTESAAGHAISTAIDLTPYETITAGPGAGETTRVWDVSAAIASVAPDGILTGDLVDGLEDGTQTTAQITYRAEILDQYTPDGSVGDPEVSQGDVLSNNVTVEGTVRENGNDTNVIGTEENTSSVENQLPFGSIREKTVFALNGMAPDPSVVVSAGDTVTWRVVYDAPLGSFEDLSIADNLPQNVFDAAEVTTFIDPSTVGFDASVPPPAGSAQYGPGDTFNTNGGGNPSISIDAPNNGVNFEFVNLSVDPRQAVVLEILFTVTVEDAIFADGLLLTNQATAFESNTFSGSVDSTAIANFVYAEPVLQMTKGVVADNSPDPSTQYNNADGTTTASPDYAVAFSAPGSTGPRFGSTITSDDLETQPIDSNIYNVDAGDVVTFAIVVENVGSGPNGAFNVEISDTIPTGFTAPPGGFNLSVTDGTGARAITYTGDLFNTPMVLDDRGPEGSLSAYDPTAGDNIAIITYDLLVEQSISSNEFLQNTATLSNYNAFEGSPGNEPIDRTPVDLTDTAFATTEDISVSKTLLSTEFSEGAADEVLVGEEFTFTVRVDLQEATYENAIVTDTVNPGGAFGDYEILEANLTDFNAQLNATTGLVQGDMGTVAADGNSVSFDFGTLTNASNQSIADDYFEFTVLARSLGSDTDTGGGDTLQNIARFTADDVDSQATGDVEVIEPELTIDKSAGPAIVRAGETVNYALDIENVASASGAPAFDLVITDVLDPNVTLDVGSIVVLVDSINVTGTSVVTGNTSGDTTIEIRLPRLEEGAELDITYTATVIPTVEAAITIDNTADLTFDSLETDDAADERDYTLEASADVVTASPDIDKQVVATSNDDTSGTDLAIGETVTYEIVISIPEGEATNAQLVDVLPSVPGTLTYVDSEIIRIGLAGGGGNISGSALAVGAEGSNSGATTTFDFGDLLNSVDLTIDDADEIVVQITAILTDLADNQDGETLTNTATFSTDEVSVSDTATIDVVEPSLDIDKTGPAGPLDAGTTVTYTVTSTNNGTAPAYDIILEDTLSDAGVEASAPAVATIIIRDGGGTDVTPTGADAPTLTYPTAGGGLQAIIPELSPGHSIEIVFDAVLTDAVPFDGEVPNTAEVTRYDSDPAGDATDADDGRVYDEDLSGYTVPSDGHDIDTPAPSLGKTIVGTDNLDTSGTNVGISEIVTYELRIDIPEGTSTFTVEDDLPPGLAPVSAEVTTYDGVAMSSNLALGDDETSTFITVGANGGYIFDFGTLTNTGDNNTGNDFIIMTVTAQVDDVAAAFDGANLENTATLTLLDPISGDPLIDPDTGNPQTYSDSADVDVVEPELDIDKTGPVGPLDAGDTASFTVTSENIGTGPAYDIVIDDALADAGLAASSPPVANVVIRDSGGLDITPGGADAPSIVYPTVGGGLEVTVPVLQPGQVIEITYDAVVTDAAGFSSDIENTAEVTRFDSDPDGDTTDTDDGRVYDEDLTGYTVPSDDHSFPTPDPSISKTVVATDNSATAGTDVGISELITYELRIDIPEGTSAITVSDDLPAGLVAVSAEVTTYDVVAMTSDLTLGDDETSSAISVGPDGGFVFEFGSFTNTGDNNAANDFFVLTVTARVDDVAGAFDGANLENSATLALVDPVTGDILIDPDSGLPQTYSDTADVDVVEPELNIDKVVDPTTADAGDTVEYTVTSTNIGNGPAYDIVIDDDLSDLGLTVPGTTVSSIRILDGMTDVTPTGADAPNIIYPTGSDGLQASIPVLLPGQTIEIVYEAVVSDAAVYSSDVTNTAEVTRYDTDPAGDGTDPDSGRVYDVDLDGYTVPSDDAVVTTPDVTLSKDYITSSDVATPNGPQEVGIGETITYNLTIDVPEGSGDLLLTDVLPAGLEALTAEIISIGAGTSTAENLSVGDTDASGFITIAAGGGSVEFDFGTVVTTGTDDASTTGAQIVVEVVSRVRDVAGNVDTATLENNATLEVTDPATGNPVQTDPTASETVTVVEPDITIEKTGPIAANPGDVVDYQFRLENLGTGPAHDIFIQDPFTTPELSLNNAPTFLLNGGVITPTVTPLGDGFSTIIPTMEPGDILVVDFEVRISLLAEDAESFPNDVIVDYDTVPDGDPSTSTARTYETEDDHSIGTVPFLTKEANDSDIAQTGSDQFDAENPDAAVGEVITYTLAMYLPEVPMDSVIMVDTLPDGLQFVTARFVSAGTGITGADAGDGFTNLGAITTFDFGAVNNPLDGTIGADDIITVEIDALVIDDLAFTSAGDTLTNNATLDVIAAGGIVLNQATATEVLDVVDPELTLEKSGPIAAEQGDTVTYTVEIENIGTGPAFDTVITDTMSDPNLIFQTGSVTNIELGGATITPTVSSAGSGFSFTVPVILPGEVLTFEFEAEIGAGAAQSGALVNTVEADYNSDPAGSGRDGSVEDDHPISTGPQLEKTTQSSTIDATDDANGTNPLIPDLVVGEEVTFNLLVTLPEIAMDDIVLVDTLPAGLQFVGAAVDATNPLGATATITNLGQVVTIDFDPLVNPFDGTIGADDEVNITITALVLNSMDNVDGQVWTNSAELTVTPEGQAPFTPVVSTTQVEIVEPDLSIVKIAPIAVDPGETVNYELEIVNSGTGPAADILIVDALDLTPFLTYDSGSIELVMTPASGPSIILTPTVTETASGFEVTVPELLAGARLDVTYTATLSEDAPLANSFVNDATITYDTVPDGDPETPTGRSDTETDSESVATAPALTKDATSSSLDDTGSSQGNPDFLDLNIGEEVTFTLELPLPEIPLDSVILEDELPIGLSYVDAEVVDYAGVTPISTTVITNSGQLVEFDFGQMNNPSDGTIGADDVIIVSITARVDNIVSNTAITSLTNNATLNIIADGGVPLEEQRAEDTVEVVEPELELEKTGPFALNPGDTGAYSLEITNTGSGAAYDTLISDPVADANLDFESGTVIVTLDGVIQSFAIDESGTGFEVTVPVIEAGQTVVVTFDVTLSENATPVESFDNLATIAYDNVPGDTDPNGSSRPQTDSDDHRVATIPTLTKEPIATSDPNTGDGVHDPDLLDLNVGEDVTFELVLTLPEIPMEVVLVDTLPVGLEYVSSSVVSIGSEITAGAPTITVSGQTITYDFGLIDNAYNGVIDANDQVRIELVAKVDNVAAAQDGAQLTNTSALTVTPDGEPPLETQTDTATIEVVEPNLNLTKTVNDETPTIGDTITYSLVLTNTGTGPSYNMLINDPLPFELSLTGNIVLSDPSLATVTSGSTNGDTSLIISIPRLLPGETLEIDYDVFIGYNSDVLTGLQNTADVSGSSSTDPSDPGRIGSGTLGRDDGDGDQVTIVADPIPVPEESEGRIPHLGIDDAQFLPVLLIDPIYTGVAEPGSNVTISLYRDDGSLTSTRHILADAGGHWIAVFPSVQYEAVEEGFWNFYSRSNVFDAPIQTVDALARDTMGFTGDPRDLVVGTRLDSEAHYVELSADRPSTLPQENGMFNARTFYATAHHQEAFLKADTLRVDEVFESIAAHTVDRLYAASVDPLATGLNRFNYEFLTEATATPGSAR